MSESCSVIVPIHKTNGQYGSLMLSLVASVISEVEDRFTGMFKLLSLS